MIDRYQKILLLRFDPVLGPDDERELYRLFADLRAVAGSSDIRYGVDTCGRNRGYQYALVMSFDSESGYEAYMPHPAHIALAAFVTARRYESLGFNFPFPQT